jgi:hypothetical protein
MAQKLFVRKIVAAALSTALVGSVWGAPTQLSNRQLQNSSVTINGHTVSLGGSTSVTPADVHARQTFSNANVTVTVGTTQLAQTGTMSAARTVTFPAASAYTNGTGFYVIDESGTLTTTK